MVLIIRQLYGDRKHILPVDCGEMNKGKEIVIWIVYMN